MNDIAIRVTGLGKRYHIGTREVYKTLRTSIMDTLSAPARGLRKLLTRDQPAPAENAFWALKDVAFEIPRGEVVGVIGANGAGKSTLLKVLSRITEPTEGFAEIHGRVGSLLEVGTGFHPELTGRENIFLNGAILGMHRAEIERKFDEIVAFAEVTRFIDTPVKHYSSGMYLRLAFAVAAHLETQILIVDEVLAVGDTAFQKKCLGKMGAVARSGRTVLLVSHNLGAVRALCQSAIWLESGRVKMSDQAERVTLAYLAGVGQHAPGKKIEASQHLRGNGAATIEFAELKDDERVPKDTFLIGEPITLNLHYKTQRAVEASFWILVNSSENQVILSSFQKDVAAPMALHAQGTLSVRLTGAAFLPGAYSITTGIFDAANNVVDWVEGAIRFEVLTQFADGRAFDHRYGWLTQAYEWTHQP